MDEFMDGSMDALLPERQTSSCGREEERESKRISFRTSMDPPQEEEGRRKKEEGRRKKEEEGSDGDLV
jgi:hypothetical protein